MSASGLRAVGALVTAMAVASALAACGTGSSGGGAATAATSGGIKVGPGIDAKSKTISLGVLSPLSGVVGEIGTPLTAGQQTYFNALNARGGIDGWKVNLVIRDDKYDPQTEVQEFNQISGQIAFLAQSLGSPTTAAIKPMVDQLKMVTGAATQDSAFVNDPVMAVIGTPYAVDDANAVAYLSQTGVGPSTKIGVIYQDDEYGHDGMLGFNAGLKTYHLHSVAQATYAPTDTDFTAQVQKMRSAGARYVFLIAIPNVAASVIGTAASEGYKPTWVLQGPAWSEYLMSANGLPGGKPTAVAKAFGSNVLVLGYEAQWGDTSAPGMAKFVADTKTYAPKQIPDYYYMYGYAEANVEAAIIRKALAAKDLTRQGFLNAKLNLGSVDMGGLLPPVTYTPGLGPASRETEIARVNPKTPGFLDVFKPYFEGAAARSLTFAK